MFLHDYFLTQIIAPYSIRLTKKLLAHSQILSEPNQNLMSLICGFFSPIFEESTYIIIIFLIVKFSIQLLIYPVHTQTGNYNNN